MSSCVFNCGALSDGGDILDGIFFLFVADLITEIMTTTITIIPIIQIHSAPATNPIMLTNPNFKLE